MEFDDDVQRLAERSRSRREMIAKKRRTAAVEEHPFQEQEHDCHADIDESPKRQCLNYVGEVNSINEESDGTLELDCDKENDYDMSDGSVFVPHKSSDIKGLAALKRQKALDDFHVGRSENQLQDDIKVNTPYISCTKSRLASLAANIKQWDDEDLNLQFQTNINKPINRLATNRFFDNAPNLSALPSKSVRFQLDSNEDTTILASSTQSNVRDEIICNKQKSAHVQKVRVWDKAILTTLESQGFVKSPSRAKLQFDFSSAPNQNETAAESEDTDEEMQLPHTKVNAPGKTLETAVKSVIPSNNGKNEKLNLGSNMENNIDKSSIRATTDPAELPLSARKALFERAFVGGHSKQTENVVEQNLSVAQRAALFEKATKAPAPKMQPPKADPVDTKMSSPRKMKPLVSPEQVILLSPSASASSHTRAVQQNLIDNSSNEWKKKEHLAKACEERKNEISALLNHWEKVSTSSAENGSTDISHDAYKKSSSSGSEKYVPVFQKAEDNNREIPDDVMDDSQEDDEDSESNIEDELITGQDGMSSFNSESTQSESMANEEELGKDLNDILDEAFEQTESPQMPPPTSSTKVEALSSDKISSGSCNGSTSSQNYVFEKGQRTDTYSEGSQGDSESPLLHTVSFYRKQKQQKRITPVRTIIRRPEVISPPSPKKMSAEMMATKLKTLQEEVLAQQIVISQTSQALNLCHATEEFSGSTEQVEGERLLLIATQKRMACLNDIQKLKTSNGKLDEEGKGTLILNDLKLPLKRDFITSQLTGGTGDAVHYFLCLVRHGSQVIVTQMLSAQESVQNGSLSFTNHITIHNLPSDFSVAFEVYTLQTKREVLPHDKKYHIKRDHSKIRLTPKSKKSDSKLQSPAISSPGGPNAVRTPSFAVVGYTRFTLQNCNRQSCTLEKVPFSSPLEGVLLLKMQLHAEHSLTERGFLTMFEDVSGFGAWHRRWCVLGGNTMAFWKYPDDEKRKEPIIVIDLKQCITREFRLVSRDICARPHTFELLTVRPQEKSDKNTLISRSVNTLTTTKYLLSADTKEERIMWCKRLNNVISNVRKWDPNALHPFESK